MGTYKVLQDIEAEDKFVGPLTLRQFILAGIAAVGSYVCFFLFIKHLWFIALFVLPIVLFAGFLAFPWGRDQPTEIWLLAKIRFMLKPRRRIWDQSGMQELVTITAPKHVDHYISDNLSQTEVKSRLKALAETIDSRGWAVKNASVNFFNQPSAMANLQSDRLIDAGAFAREVPNVDVHASDDILDEKNNPTALHLSEMVTSSGQAHRQATLKNLKDISQHKKHHKEDGKHGNKQPDFWFMREPDAAKIPKNKAAFGAGLVITPDDDATVVPPSTKPEDKLPRQIKTHAKSKAEVHGHTRVAERTVAKSKPPKKTDAKANSNRDSHTSLETLKPAILNLANNNDLTVATIAHEANKKPPAPKSGDLSSDEVVIPLR